MQVIRAPESEQDYLIPESKQDLEFCANYFPSVNLDNIPAFKITGTSQCVVLGQIYEVDNAIIAQAFMTGKLRLFKRETFSDLPDLPEDEKVKK